MRKIGLDITSYERVQLTDPHEHEEGCWDRNHVWVYTQFEHSLGSLLPERCYVTNGAVLGFRAGSYSGYSRWREELCQAAHGVPPNVIWANPDEWAGRPFVELINFSDCEGTIGPEVCAKLARDFQENHSVRAILPADEYDWYVGQYDQWQEAFELAASDGAVVFH